MPGKYYWIKERHNPQLGVYYSCLGRITGAEAKQYEKSLYGTNYMHKFSSVENYQKEIDRLKAEGASFI